MSEEKLFGNLELTSKVTTLNVLAAGAAVLVASLALIALQYFSLRSALLDELGSQSRVIGDNGASALVFGDAAAARKTLSSLSSLPHIREAELLTAGGEVLAAYRQETAPEEGADWPREGHRFSLRTLDVVGSIEFDGQPVGSVRLRAGLDSLYGRLLGYAATTLAVCASALGLALLLVSRMRRVVRRAESRLHFLAHTDPVTHLPNRHAFNERLAFAAARVRQFGGSLALLAIDLDNFKLVNDTLGHQSGDVLLSRVAQRFGGILRREDVVCRTGGDEFAVILEHADREKDAAHIAGKLLGSLAAPIVVGNQEIFVAASIGISFFPADAENTEELVRNADTALYAAKGRGKGMFELFTPAMNERAHQRLSLESRLRRALERREFLLHYQPQIDLRTGRVVGVEALLRWREGGKEMIGPDRFIPIAEESGLIVPIGQWVLQEACAQVRRWIDRGLPPLRMAVNLSARQFDSPTLVQDIFSAAGAARLGPDLLELEITESALMRNTAASASTLRQLSDAGYRLSVDDFGTGYSSMSYLKRFPIDHLKIDRSFVTDLTVDKDDDAIVAAIVAMSHALGLEVVAEGVETREQYARLQELGCDLAQGYLMSRPMAADDLEKLLAAPSAVPSVPA